MKGNDSTDHNLKNILKNKLKAQLNNSTDGCTDNDHEDRAFAVAGHELRTVYHQPSARPPYHFGYIDCSSSLYIDCISCLDDII